MFYFIEYIYCLNVAAVSLNVAEKPIKAVSIGTT